MTCHSGVTTPYYRYSDNKKVVGIMYCGDEVEFDSKEEYLEAYKEEEDEIIEELERLYAIGSIEYPEDF